MSLVGLSLLDSFLPSGFGRATDQLNHPSAIRYRRIYIYKTFSSSLVSLEKEAACKRLDAKVYPSAVAACNPAVRLNWYEDLPYPGLTHLLTEDLRPGISLFLIVLSADYYTSSTSLHECKLLTAKLVYL